MAEQEQSTVAFVQEWMMSGDHEPDQWHRDFAAAIDARTPNPDAVNADKALAWMYVVQMPSREERVLSFRKRTHWDGYPVTDETPLYATPVPDKALMRDTAVGERYRHLKRGTVYQVIGTADLQMSFDLVDGAQLVIYRGDNGQLWAREEGEFHDGRFERLTTPTPVEEPENHSPDAGNMVSAATNAGQVEAKNVALRHALKRIAEFGHETEHTGDGHAYSREIARAALKATEGDSDAH